MSGQKEQKPHLVASQDEEIHLADLLVVLARQKKLVIGMSILAGTVAMVLSLLNPPVFTSTAKITLAQQQSSGMAALLGNLGGPVVVADSMARLKHRTNLYVGMLESRTISDTLIQRFNLKERYKSASQDDARFALAKVVKIVNEQKNGLIAISVSDKDPKFAADLANAYIGELTSLAQTMAINEASQRRFFFKEQLKAANDELVNAVVAHPQMQEKTGQSVLEDRAQATTSGVAQLRAPIAAQEAQLMTMRTYAAVQYELAKIDESRDFAVILVLDKAVPADAAVKPKHALNTFSGLLGGGSLGVLIALIAEGYRRSRAGSKSIAR